MPEELTTEALIAKVKDLKREEVINRILEIVYSLSLGQQRTLLAILEKIPQEKSVDEPRPVETEAEKKEMARKYDRQISPLVAKYLLEDQYKTHKIQDISLSGVFIETEEKIPMGKELFITLGTMVQNKFRVQGKVVRVTPKGIGVQFQKVFKS